ncbi:serine protease [Kibdelosporangium philippinense]|uniref:Serine protease n=1 Tax=Kibdelosporangium philippinense TaxID=211113 RepID=A0ABS8ZJD9_9PSEU|nr:serine protease [Kibdelosporangium philippinense]MCE7007652.1 serine protease [Kibdelosporangium philippinense]
MRDKLRVGRLLAVVCLLAGLVAAAVPASADVRIVGGTRASTQQYPFVVYLAGPDGFQFCGGTLASSIKVITAAHCVKNQVPKDVIVVAGRDDKKNRSEGLEVAVKGIWTHTKYSDALAGHDVAVLTLATPITAYKALPIATSNDDFAYAENTDATILGWGRTSSGGSTSQYLLQAQVPVVSDESCQSSFPKYNSSAMVCAGYPQGGIDGCQGDSGGPLIAHGRLLGISSWGEGCALPNKPGVYTRVMSYYTELMQQIKKPMP